MDATQIAVNEIVGLLHGETVEQCAARMLAQHQADRERLAQPVRLTARCAARLTAEGIARSWRTAGQDELAKFYAAVAAVLSND